MEGPARALEGLARVKGLARAVEGPARAVEGPARAVEEPARAVEQESLYISGLLKVRKCNTNLRKKKGTLHEKCRSQS